MRTANYEDAFADYESWDVPRNMRRARAMQAEIPIQLGQLPLSSITIAERLKEKNYATGFFGKWHLGPDADKHPEYQGFDVAIADTPLGFPRSFSAPHKNQNLKDGPTVKHFEEFMWVSFNLLNVEATLLSLYRCSKTKKRPGIPRT